VSHQRPFTAKRNHQFDNLKANARTMAASRGKLGPSAAVHAAAERNHPFFGTAGSSLGVGGSSYLHTERR